MESLRTDNVKSFSSPEFPFQLPFAARHQLRRSFPVKTWS
jgi:hypothetical protein